MGGSTSALLNASVAVVSPAAAGSGTAFPDELLVSSGRGDLRLLQRQADGTGDVFFGSAVAADMCKS